MASFPSTKDGSTTSGYRLSQDSVGVAMVMAASGGFLDAFTFFGHRHVFANAMTANLVLLGAYAATRQWAQSLRYLPPILAFLLGVAAAQVFRIPRVQLRIPHPAVACLSAEILFLFAAGFWPATVSDVGLVLGISFIAALQSTTFPRVEKWAYNSTMATGNLRKFGESLSDALFGLPNPDALRQVRLFGLVTVAFAAGAVLGGSCTLRLGNRALWVGAALLLFAWCPLTAGIVRRPSTR